MLPNLVKRLDLFGEAVPNFNLRGQTKVKTSFGAVATILIVTLTFMFSLVKLDHMVLRKSPNLTSNEEEFDTSERSFDTSSDELMMAFAVTDSI